MRRRRGFTLIEMLTTAALLVILLGLMMDLAGYVRNRSANDLTRQVLAGLDEAMGQYLVRYQSPPSAPPLGSDPELSADQETLLQNAADNNRAVVTALNRAGLLKGELFARLPPAIFDNTSLSDAWDTPIVFMPVSHGKIGVAPSGAGFFFSAGPDRLYKTREDNLYSYEVRRSNP